MTPNHSLLWRVVGRDLTNEIIPREPCDYLREVYASQKEW